MGGLRWKKNGKMMTEKQWYASNLHFATEVDYIDYKKAFKQKFPKPKKIKKHHKKTVRTVKSMWDINFNDMF